MSQDENKKDEKKEATSSNRCWEYYLVRYFVGTVLGTLIVLYLVYQKNSGIRTLVEIDQFMKLDQFNIQWLWVYGLIGLAFCYVASSPVLVLHSFRSSIYELTRSDFRTKGIYWILFFCCLFVAGGIYFSIHYLGLNNIATILIGIVFLIQMILIVIESGFHRLEPFYLKLSSKRATDDKKDREYIESYRHLREHGNAFVILFMEVILGIILYHINNNLNFLVVTLILWVLPACSAWFIGSFLESKFANR